MSGTLLVCAALLAVDGDTIKCDGVNMREMGDGAPNVSSYDTLTRRSKRTHFPRNGATTCLFIVG